jgi:hypothetical protein
MATIEKVTLPTGDHLVTDDATKKIVFQPSEGDLRAIAAEKGRDIVVDPEAAIHIIQKPVDDDFPDGGLRAWLVVVGVRNNLFEFSSLKTDLESLGFLQCFRDVSHSVL